MKRYYNLARARCDINSNCYFKINDDNQEGEEENMRNTKGQLFKK